MGTTKTKSTKSNVNTVANKVANEAPVVDKADAIEDTDNTVLLTAAITNVVIRTTTNGTYYRLTLDKTFPAYVIRNSEFVETEVDYLDFTPTTLLAIVEAHVDNFDYLKSKIVDKANAVSQNPQYYELVRSILVGATITVDRTPFAAGEEYVDENGETAVHERDGYRKQVNDIAITAEIAAIITKAAPKATDYLKDLFGL